MQIASNFIGNEFFCYSSPESFPKPLFTNDIHTKIDKATYAQAKSIQSDEDRKLA
jgi:hypothetical protein